MVSSVANTPCCKHKFTVREKTKVFAFNSQNYKALPLIQEDSPEKGLCTIFTKLIIRFLPEKLTKPEKLSTVSLQSNIVGICLKIQFQYFSKYVVFRTSLLLRQWMETFKSKSNVLESVCLKTTSEYLIVLFRYVQQSNYSLSI